jgi:tetratricopeptide (TPR) repeat protein
VAAANAAIRLDDSSAEAHVALALVCYRLEWNWEAADREFRIALDLDEGLANAHHQYAMFLASVNRTDEAVGEIERAAELDPDSPIIATAVGRVLQFARRYDEAIEHAVRVTQTHKDYPAAYFDLALAHMEKGQFDEALEAFQKLGEVSRDRRRDLIGQAYVYSRKGDREKTLKVIRRLTRLAEGRPVPSVTLALVHLDLGDTDRAFELLEQGYAAHDSNLVYLQCEPSFDPLRSDPRFKDLLRRMNLEQYAARSTAS